MTGLRLTLAIGAGAAFSVALLTFASTLVSYRAQGCPSLTEPTRACAAAVSMMQATALIAVAMIAVFALVLLRHRAMDA